ncbi:MAG: DoxX family membrane protein [Phycisphaerales bacterium]|nr:DoxX family membrane protein [Hyphomonadaceae bacterium]
MPSGGRRDLWRKASLALVFTWFVLGGLAHFVLTDTFVSVVPPYVPFGRAVVLVTGAIEILLALALLFGRWRPLAGLALMAFTIAVTPVHIEMLLQADQYPRVGAPLLWLRLAMQPALVWIIWFATQRRERTGPTHNDPR